MGITRRKLGAGASACFGLTGCGFHPVYAPGSKGVEGPAELGLSQINVALIPERSGQLLRDYLQQRLERAGGHATKLFDLSVSFRLAQEGVAISRADSIATRIRVVGTATWSLISLDAERRTITNGLARSIDGFNPIDLQYFYSDLQNEQVQRRVAEALADQISLQLATYFNARPLPAD